MKPARQVAEELVANIDTLPVDMDALLAKFDVRIEDHNQPNAGEIHLDEQGRWAVAINRNDPLVRQRFTLAHELGHRLLHEDKARLGLSRNQTSSLGLDRLEIEANAFASSLLMPARLVLEQASQVKAGDQHDWIRQLAAKFAVSVPAMTYRLQDLKISFYSVLEQQLLIMSFVSPGESRAISLESISNQELATLSWQIAQVNRISAQLQARLDAEIGIREFEDTWLSRASYRQQIEALECELEEYSSRLDVSKGARLGFPRSNPLARP
jgi:hypothetical protein